MMDTPPQARAVYRPSGKVDWFRFIPGLLVAAGAAIVMAWCLFLSLHKGLYLIFVAPLVVSLPAVGVWYLVLTWTHCRNKMVAAVTSFTLAVLLYFGYYHVGLLQVIGVQNAHRIDLWPRYVLFRLKTDVARDVGRPNARRVARMGPDPVEQVFNWFFFGGELLLVIGVFAAVGQHCTSKAYCEPCGRWMNSETLKLPLGTGATLWNSLERGHYADVQQRLASTSRQNANASSLTIEHCPACPAEDRSQAVYLTVKDVAAAETGDRVAAKVGTLSKPKLSGRLRTLLDHVALRPEEVGALAATFPGLRSSIEAHPIHFAEAQRAAREIGRARMAQMSEWKGRVAQIELVEPRDAGTVLTRRNAIIQTFIGIVSIFGGFGLAFAPAGVLYKLEPQPPDWVLGIAVGWMFVCLGLTLLWLLSFPTYLTAQFMLRQTRRAFEGRPDPAVDLKSPGLIFVDIIPRINWGKQMMENASDIGFLDLDKARRELIFEGGRERYWIPVESILEIKHEFWAESVKHQLQSSPTLNHLVVVRAMTADGPWETWFYRRQNKFLMRTAKRRLTDALELECKIRELMKPVS